MKPSVLPLVLPIVLASCTVTTQTTAPAKPQSVVSQPKAAPSLNLGDYALPEGANNVKVKSNNVEFRISGKSMDDIFLHYDQQFKRRGWLRVGLEERPNRIEATYKYENNLVKLLVKREGNSGKYEIELED